MGLAAALLSLAAGPLPRAEYAARRAQVAAQLDGILVLYGATARDETRDGFFQSPDFRYLTGWSEPGAALLLTPAEEILFLPPRNEREEKYTGRKLLASDPAAASHTGFRKVLPLAELGRSVHRALADYARVYANDPRVKSAAPLHEHADAAKFLAKFRMRKSPAEISLLEKSADVSAGAHLAAWKQLRPGVAEYEIAAAMEHVYRSHGCERNAYPPIVGAGSNSVILHYRAGARKLDAGDLVVMDVGAECDGYAADLTRTVPASGRFTPRQREVYEVVLGAQNAALAAARPGIAFRGEKDSLEAIAKQYIEARGFGKYWVHGLGHHVGLEVHDATDPELKLEPGMVITIEPGIYIPEENLGVRIEDMVLITENGARLLSARLPRDPAEIEKLAGQR
jgi:Xaa-Pro aminopeptidase